MIVLGLDVGSRQIKGIVLKKTLFKTTVIRAFKRPVTGPPTVDDVRRIVNEEAPGLEVLVLSVPRDLVVNRNLSFPFKDLKKVKLVVPAEAERNLPFGLKDAVVAHVVADTDQPHQTQVVAFVVTRKELEPFKSLVAVGVPVKMLAIDSLGMVNAYLSEELDEEPVVLVDVGARKTSIEVLRARRLVFSRAIGMGGDTFTAAIRSSLGIDEAAAESLKIGLSRTEEPDAQARKALAALAEVYKKLVRELKLTVLSARNTWADLKIASVWLAGESARLPGLTDAIAAGLETRASVLAARPLIHTSGGAADPALVSAYGLALAGAGKAQVDIDFLGQPRDFFRYHRHELALCGVLLAVLTAGDFLSTVRRLSLLRSEMAQTERSIDDGIREIAKLARVHVDARSVKARGAQIQKLMEVLTEDCASRLALINEVSRAIPETTDVTLQSLQIEGGRATLEGTTDSFDTLQKLEEALKKGLGRPIEVRPPRNEPRDDKMVTVFTITFPAQKAAKP